MVRRNKVSTETPCILLTNRYLQRAHLSLCTAHRLIYSDYEVTLAKICVPRGAAGEEQKMTGR